MSKTDTHMYMLMILPPELQAEANRLALEENPDNLPAESDVSNVEMAALIKKRWHPGKILKVYFMDGDPRIQSKVEQFVHTWEQYANIKFSFVKEPNAEIRVSFQYNGSWSWLGTDCLLIPKNEPTVNFGWFDSETSDIEYSRTVVHEFGHVLGCAHEHSSPAADIPWDKPAVYKYYMGPPNNWSKEKIDYNLFNKYSYSEVNASPFDPKSIMIYPIPNSMTIGDFEVKGNTTLSEMDKQFIRKVYPFGQSAGHTALVSSDHERAAAPIRESVTGE